MTDVLKNRQIRAAAFELPSGPSQAAKFRLGKSHYALMALAALAALFIAFISLAKSVQVTIVTPHLTKPDTYVALNAQAHFSTALKLPIANRVMLLAGQHQLEVSADGYQTLQQTVQLSGDRYQQFELIMAPLPGQLEVSLEPAIESMAQVTVAQMPSVSLPAIVADIPAGEQQVVVDAPLYRPQMQAVLIRGRGLTETLQLSLVPAWAEYTFSTQPAGAEVALDGEVLGETPLTVKLEEGLNLLTFSKQGFKPVQQEVAVVAQQDINVPAITLSPADGLLNLTSQPPGAAVIVDSVYQGVTPLELSMQADKAHKLQVFKAGYTLHQQSVALAAAQRDSQQVDLKADLVEVTVSVSPSDAQVLVDGQLRGRGNQTISMNTLPHRISVRKPGYVPFNTEIIPTKRNQQIVSVKLLTEEQHYWAQIPNTYTNALGHQLKLFKPSATFPMGSSRREAGRRANEVQFSARLDKPFYVALHETSNKQFRAFKASHNAGNYKKKSLDANKAPAVNISWQLAAQYCNWLSKKEGLDPFYQTRKGFISGNNWHANGYRLLTEAEWSWLARIDQDKVLTYPWGDSKTPPAKPVGNFADQSAAEIIAFTLDNYRDGFKGTAPVGRFPANHNGLFDLGGNASEWVNDWYNARGSRAVTKVGVIDNPAGPKIGEFHVVRGASWAKGHLPQLRLAYRDYAAKGKHDIGFRIARYAGPSKKAPAAQNSAGGQ